LIRNFSIEEDTDMPGLTEIRYTICPVGNASYIAAHKGWLEEGLAPFGVEPVLLQSLPQERWKAHFDYSDEALFREGGNIPPIWAKSRGAEVVLIGTALPAQKQCIVVRVDSPVYRLEQLANRRLGIPVRSRALIDFHKATALQGFRVALALRGFSLKEADLVEIVTEGNFHSTPIDDKKNHSPLEFEALEKGEVDALYVKLSTIQKVLDTGNFRVLFDLAADKKQIAPINNEYPEVLTVSRRLAEEHPEVVTAYVKQVVRASIWAKTNYFEALRWLSQQTHATPSQAAASFEKDFNDHMTLSLSKENLKILEGQKRFLFDNGFIERDFDLADWADSRFLERAYAEFELSSGSEK
jgi:2'-hydroxybiphenyl-2-sulfinate desulfinase